jgi:pilus assembly protein CpaE
MSANPQENPFDDADAPAQPPRPQVRAIPRINIQCFCEEAETAQVLSKASSDRRLAKAHVTVQMGGVQAATAYYKNAPTPNLILIESTLDAGEMLTDLDRLAEVCDSGTKVMAIGHVNDVLLYRELMRRGLSEYLVAPLNVAQVMDAIGGLYSDPKHGPVGQVIAFLGAKGGSGSSTVCHNTAYAISEGLKSEVVIADFDLAFGTAGLDFNQDPIQGLFDALSAPERLDEMLLDRLLARCSEHLSLFAAPGTLDRAYDVDYAACGAVLDLVRQTVPFVAADLPHLWTGWAKQTALHADQVVLTAAPDLANLRNAKNLIDQLKASRPNDRPPLLVINQTGVPKRPEIPVSDFADALETKPTVVIEFDAALFGTASNNGQMIEETNAKSRAAEQFRLLAAKLSDRAGPQIEKSSVLDPILARLKRIAAKG